MIELVIKRIREAVTSQGGAILLVGRGSSDPQTTSELQQIGAAVSQKSTCLFSVLLTNGIPTFTDGLADTTASYQHVYVVPYLLFTGLLLRKIKLHTKNYANVITCNCLQFDAYMKSALLERMEECVHV